MKFEISEPESELTEGYFNLTLKYSILFITSWIGGWFFLLFISSGRRNRRSALTTLLFDNPEYTSILVAVVIVYFIGYQAYTKYKLGLITSINIDNEFVLLTLLNTVNGKSITRKIEKSNFKVRLTKRDDKFFGEQRFIEIYEKAKLISKLNIDMTAWCRHPEINALITELAKSEIIFK